MKDHVDQPLWVLAGLIAAFGMALVFVPAAADTAKDVILTLSGGLLTYVYGRQKSRTGSQP